MKGQRIADIMTSKVATVSAGSTVQDAAKLMQKLDVGAVPVEDGGSLKGMVTDRDIALRLVAEGRDPGSTSVGDIMTPGAITCSPTDGVRDVEKKMEGMKVRRIVVIDDQKHPVGIVSIGDIAVGAGQKEGGEVLEKIAEHVRPQA